MKTLVEDEELRRRRAMAEGSRPSSGQASGNAAPALDLKEIQRYPPRERLGVGYFTAAQRRTAQLQADGSKKIAPG